MVTSSGKKFLILIAFPCLLTVSCSGKRDKSTDGDLPQLPQIVQVQLSNVPVDPNTNIETSLTLGVTKIDHNIKFKAYLQYDRIGEVLSDKSFGQRLSVIFNDLSKSQFDTLKKAYGGAYNATEYSEDSSYSLTDFLPPMMQAMIGYIVTSKGVEANCWGTVYEVQRNPGISMDLFYVRQNDILQVLNDDKYSTHIATIKPSQGDRLDNIDIRYMDAVLVVAENDAKQELLHAVTLIDREIVFEKTSIQLPYRLNTVNSLYELYKDATFIVRRFNKAQLPTSVESMAGKIKSMATVQFELHDDGTYRLPQKYIQLNRTGSARK
jgi:hypothetical protein